VIRAALAGIGLALLLPGSVLADVAVGSKKFTESVVLGEVLTQLARAEGVEASHRRELGGTAVLWKALQAGDIDLYVEYSGTLELELLPGEEVAAGLAARGLVASAPLGFDNTYALGMVEARAEELGITRIGQLAEHPWLKLGFSNEFVEREDGWPSVRATYGLAHQPRGLDHDLAYRGLQGGSIDVIDLYSTDAEIAWYGLRVLEDDRDLFPEYAAFVLHRTDLPGVLVDAVGRLEGSLSAARMAGLNAAVKIDRQPDSEVAAAFLRGRGVAAEAVVEGAGARLVRHGLEHLTLTGTSLLAALLVALPLGVLAARSPRLGQGILVVTGLIQTIPSLALLVFFIPLLGIGGPPAIAALFLYSLLPVVRNTHAGLTDIAPAQREAAEALGLPPRARLRLVELPLASRHILAGIQTAAVINVGTATLGALVGAGGYGQPILTGIRLDDTGLILQGAIPAALLALAVQGGFELLGRWFVPKGLRLREPAAGGPGAPS